MRYGFDFYWGYIENDPCWVKWSCDRWRYSGDIVLHAYYVTCQLVAFCRFFNFVGWWTWCVMQIMLLTDGDVSNTRAVIDLVRRNASNTRYVWKTCQEIKFRLTINIHAISQASELTCGCIVWWINCLLVINWCCFAGCSHLELVRERQHHWWKVWLVRVVEQQSLWWTNQKSPVWLVIMLW